MILIVGLGNPGEKYNQTRHNIGFMVVDHLLNKLNSVKDSSWETEKKFNSYISRSGKEIIMAKPLSFMNASGEVVAKLMTFYKVPSFGLYVVHDDVDIPLGKIKISIDKNSAGHKGIESIIEKLGSKNFVRIRVGVGKDEKIPTDRYVLLPFSYREQSKLKQTIKKAVEATLLILKEGAEKAASRYNQ